MLFVNDSVPHVQRIRLKGISSTVSKLYFRRTCNWRLRYGEGFVLLGKGEIVLQGKFGKLIGIKT